MGIATCTLCSYENIHVVIGLQEQKEEDENNKFYMPIYMLYSFISA